MGVSAALPRRPGPSPEARALDSNVSSLGGLLDDEPGLAALKRPTPSVEGPRLREKNGSSLSFFAP